MAGIDAPLEEELARHAFANDVLDALTKPFKELLSRYLCDERGSVLFDRIKPGWYPARCLETDWPQLTVAGVVGDFERDLADVERVGDTPRLVASHPLACAATSRRRASREEMCTDADDLFAISLSEPGA
ncbi:MAG TPA: hypothetical protein VFN65_11250 [Solirubrobacteraceae bacterium]|nr:hypothetical protein [Solirubrobacteraceae bacterium]